MKHVITVILFMVLSLPAYSGKISIKNIKLERERNKVSVEFTVKIPRNTVRRDFRLFVTPQLYNDNGSMDLKTFTIAGGKNQKRERKRTVKEKSMWDNQNIDNGTTFKYTMTVKYEPWMENNLSLRINKTGEGTAIYGTSESLGTSLIAGPIELPLPDNPIVTPATPDTKRIDPLTLASYPFLVKVGKTPTMDKSTTIQFDVANATIDLNSFSNNASIKKIMDAINLIRNNKYTKLEKITIIGYASPEGNHGFNEELSANRANALAQLLEQQMSIPKEMFEVQAGGENWHDLTSLTERMGISHKDQIKKIVEETPEEQRNNRLKMLDGGRPYRSLLEVLYPRLRSAHHIAVWYSDKPDLVPDIVNSAIAKFETNNYNAALEILMSVKDDSRSWNAIGSCYMMLGNFVEARKWLSWAAEVGDEIAKRNLELI
ncbi:OmpA family protein [Bacteroides sp. 519]|uniref:OmpA family protein n=1 Tax=Bacteroides sp. 519 TaxID=2302937 RepID=UPI0013D6B543|nr:OmpA family protein [Bacteroides sp. 519]